MSTTEYDRLSVLTCRRPLLATKLHTRISLGRWSTKGYGRMLTYSARVVRLSCFEEMARLFRSLEMDRRALVIRDLPREGQNLANIKRQKATFAPQPVGLRAMGIDVDEITFKELGVEVDPTSRESLENAIKRFISVKLPRGLQEASCWYQWSSSAGVKPWSQYRVHLWYWLDRPVHRDSLNAWAKTVHGVDDALYRSVQVHYCARPVFVDPDGGQLPDVMGSDEKGSLRSGIIRGTSDVATAPSIWLDAAGVEALKVKQKAKQKARRTGGAKRTFSGSPEDILAGIAQDLDTLPSTGRHEYVRAKIRTAFGLRDCMVGDPPAPLSLSEIADAVRGNAIASLVSAGRSHDVASGEVSRIIDFCWDAANAPALESLAIRAKDIRQRYKRKLGKSVASPEPSPVEEIQPEWLTPEVQWSACDLPEGKHWPAPAEGWTDDNADMLTLAEGRVWLDQAMISALAAGGSHSIAAPAGSGKSYAAKQRCLIDQARDGARALLVVPTLRLAAEAADDLMEMAKARGLRGWRAEVAASRRPDTCHYHSEVALASTLAPEGGSIYCRGCEFHPQNVGDAAESCPFFAQMRRQKTANVVVQTHALYSLQDHHPGATAAAPVDWSTYEALETTRARLVLVQTQERWRALLEDDADGFEIPAPQYTTGGKLKQRIKDRIVELVTDQRASATIKRQWSAMIIDEDPSGAMLHSGALTTLDLQALRGSANTASEVVISDAVMGRFSQLCETSKLEGKVFSATDLMKQIPADQWEVIGRFTEGKRAIFEALDLPPENHIDLLKGASVPWRTIQALSVALEQSWGCSEIRDGKLHLSYSERFDLQRAETIIHLDATTSEARSKALLGESCEFKRLHIEWPESVDVHWIPCNAGSRSRLITPQGVPGGRRVPLIWRATLRAYCLSPDSLMVTRKALKAEGAWTAALLEEAQSKGCAVLHHRGPGGRGLNEFQNRSTVVLDPWHVPGHAIQATAYQWCLMAGQDWMDTETREYWEREAGAQLLSAEVLQELARIRPLNSTPDNPKRIVILDSRDPRSIGLPVSRLVNPDGLVWDTLGASTGSDTGPSITRSVVEHAGGVYAPTLDAQNPWRISYLRLVTGGTVQRQSYISDDQGLPLSPEQYQPLAADVICGWTSNHGPWESLARRAGVALAWVENDRGSAIPILYTRRVSRAALESWIRPMGIKHYRVLGDARWITPYGVELSLLKACMDIKVDSPEAAEPDALLSQVATLMGVDTRTVQRHLVKLRAPEERSCACLVRLIVEAQQTAAVLIRERGTPEQQRAYLDALEPLHAALQRYGVISPRLALHLEVWRSDLDIAA